MTNTPATLSREQSRQLDQRAQEEYGIPGLVLMENAGRGVVDALERLGAESPIGICCGKGNNAGDGFVIARHLDLRGYEVRLLLFANPVELTGDALANFEIVRRSQIPIEIFLWDETSDREALDTIVKNQLHGVSWIVDALLGTGAKGAPRAPLDDVIDIINDHPAPTLAVDLPSGFDCDTGQGSEYTIRAQHTCTFVACKPGFLAEGAVEFTGQVEVLDIGAPRCLVEEMLAAAKRDG